MRVQQRTHTSVLCVCVYGQTYARAHRQSPFQTRLNSKTLLRLRQVLSEQLEPCFWNAGRSWGPFSSHCSFWTFRKARYGKLRLMTKCNILKLLKVFVFPLISFTTEWKGWKMILFFTVIICLTSQILCGQKTSSEVCVCWDPAHKGLVLSHSSIIITSCLRRTLSLCPCCLRPVNHFRQKLS